MFRNWKVPSVRKLVSDGIHRSLVATHTSGRPRTDRRARAGRQRAVHNPSRQVWLWALDDGAVLRHIDNRMLEARARAARPQHACKPQCGGEHCRTVLQSTMAVMWNITAVVGAQGSGRGSYVSGGALTPPSVGYSPMRRRPVRHCVAPCRRRALMSHARYLHATQRACQGDAASRRACPSLPTLLFLVPQRTAGATVVAALVLRIEL